jgi:hypothetical protein
MLLGFLVVELTIGFLALMIVLTCSDLYLQEGRRLLTPRGELVVGPTFERLTPTMVRLIAASRRIRSATGQVVVRAHRQGLPLLQRSWHHLRTLRVQVARLAQRRHGIAALVRPRRQPPQPAPATTPTPERSGGRGTEGSQRVARSKARTSKKSKGSKGSKRGSTRRRATRPKRRARRTPRPRTTTG